MKNYSVNIKEEKEYILSYEVKDGNIVCLLADKEKYIIPYSVENEDKVIAKMERQAKNACIEDSSWHRVGIPLGIVNLLLVMCYANTHFAFTLLTNAINILAPVMFASLTAVIVNHQIRKKDIKKLNTLLEFKDELNENILKNEDIKLGISKKAIETIEKQISQNKKPININACDNYSSRDLKILINNMNRFQSLENDENLEFNGPVLKKVLNKRN